MAFPLCRETPVSNIFFLQVCCARRSDRYSLNIPINNAFYPYSVRTQSQQHSPATMIYENYYPFCDNNCPLITVYILQLLSYIRHAFFFFSRRAYFCCITCEVPICIGCQHRYNVGSIRGPSLNPSNRQCYDGPGVSRGA